MPRQLEEIAVLLKIYQDSIADSPLREELISEITERIDFEIDTRRHCHDPLHSDVERLAHFGSWELDYSSTSMYWSEELYKIFETDESIFKQSVKGFLRFVHPEDKELLISKYFQSVRKRLTTSVDFRIVLEDGSKKYLNARIGHDYLRKRVVRGFGVIHDITMQKVKELDTIRTDILQQNKLRENKYYWYALNNSAFVSMCDKDGNILFANKLFCDELKYKQSEVLGKNHRLFNSGYYPKMFWDDFWNAILKGETFRADIRDKASDGTLVWFDTTVVPFLDESGVPYQFLAIRKNITKRKQAEQLLEEQNEELKKANMELDRFVYSTSHDLRAPLMSLLGLIDLSDEPDISKEEQKANFQLMRSCIGRLDDTIREIILYSKNSRLELTSEELDLRAIVGYAFENVRFLNKDKEIEFFCTIDSGVPFYSDKLRVVTIINNLVSNAAKYSRDDVDRSFVRITASVGESECVIRVDDNGEGIAPEKLEMIFDMFYRNSIKSEGAGLGLYICRQIVERLGGKIHVTSILHHGSSFTIYLPNKLKT